MSLLRSLDDFGASERCVSLVTLDVAPLLRDLLFLHACVGFCRSRLQYLWLRYSASIFLQSAEAMEL
jgi:hypothetical protein